MSASYRTCDNGCRGFFRSPRDRPNFQHIDAWQCPLSDEDDGFSSPRRRLHMTSQNYHLQRGSSRAYSASKAWHPSSPPRGYRGLGYRGRDRRRSEGRMDRASSFPRGRDYHNKLTQPVPPPKVAVIRPRDDPGVFVLACIVDLGWGLCRRALEDGAPLVSYGTCCFYALNTLHTL